MHPIFSQTMPFFLVVSLFLFIAIFFPSLFLLFFVLVLCVLFPFLLISLFLHPHW